MVCRLCETTNPQINNFCLECSRRLVDPPPQEVPPPLFVDDLIAHSRVVSHNLMTPETLFFPFKSSSKQEMENSIEVNPLPVFPAEIPLTGLENGTFREFEENIPEIIKRDLKI